LTSLTPWLTPDGNSIEIAANYDDPTLLDVIIFSWDTSGFALDTQVFFLMATACDDTQVVASPYPVTISATMPACLTPPNYLYMDVP